VASRRPSRYQSRPHDCAPVPARPVCRRGRGSASVDLPRAASAGGAGRRTPRRARRRQGGGIDDGGGGKPLSRDVQARAGAPRRPRRHPSRLCAADAPAAGDRGRPSGPRPGEPRWGDAHARARRRGAGKRSRAGADVGRRLGQLDRAVSRPHARREAGGDARAAQVRRGDRRDEHGAQASLAHQGRAARRARASGARGDARDLRRAGRRPRGDRLRPDRAGSDDAGASARDRRALATRASARRRARARRSGEREPEARRPGVRAHRLSFGGAAGRCVSRRRGQGRGCGLRANLPRRSRRGRGARHRGGARAARPRGPRRGPAP